MAHRPHHGSSTNNNCPGSEEGKFILGPCQIKRSFGFHADRGTNFVLLDSSKMMPGRYATLALLSAGGTIQGTCLLHVLTPSKLINVITSTALHALVYFRVLVPQWNSPSWPLATLRSFSQSLAGHHTVLWQTLGADTTAESEERGHARAGIVKPPGIVRFCSQSATVDVVQQQALLLLPGSVYTPPRPPGRVSHSTVIPKRKHDTLAAENSSRGVLTGGSAPSRFDETPRSMKWLAKTEHCPIKVVRIYSEVLDRVDKRCNGKRKIARQPRFHTCKVQHPSDHLK